MRILKTLLVATSIFAFLSVANAASLQKGTHYELIDPAQPTEVPGKIEVIEFFSYGCSHCYHLEPTINEWIKGLPRDVNFLRVPLSGGQWAPTAKLFYTLDAMGVQEMLHSAVFTSIHSDKSLAFSDESAMPVWAAKKGLDPKKFSDIYKSFAIQTKIVRATQMATSHKVNGVPTIVVDGRYVVLKDTIKSYNDLLALTDQAIEMARANKK